VLQSPLSRADQQSHPEPGNTFSWRLSPGTFTTPHLPDAPHTRFTPPSFIRFAGQT
jgi:hypothetical protein